MTQFQFYHLTKSPLETALPRLLEKAYAGGFRVLVKVEGSGMMAALDKSLWTYSPLAFLPHAADTTLKPEAQPILLSTTLENKNQANLLCITDDTLVDAENSFDRVMDMFNGQDAEAVAAARLRYKAYKDAGAEVTYFQQTETGGWEKKQ